MPLIRMEIMKWTTKNSLAYFLPVKCRKNKKSMIHIFRKNKGNLQPAILLKRMLPKYFYCFLEIK